MFIGLAHLYSTDTPFYIFYDNSKSDNVNFVGELQEAPALKVWDEDFMYVCHLNTLACTDSTSGAASATVVNGTPVLVDSSSFGKAISFDGNTALIYQQASFTPSDPLTADTQGVKWDQMGFDYCTASPPTYGLCLAHIPIGQNAADKLDSLTFSGAGARFLSNLTNLAPAPLKVSESNL